MIHAVILAGGWGRRFWPKSRSKFPKQLLCLDKDRSSLQGLVSILKAQIPKQRIWIVTNQNYAHVLRRQLPFIPKGNFLIEPLSKNTAPAIGLASFKIKRVDPKAVTLVLSSDHLIKDRKNFLKDLKVASKVAKDKNALLTIGIRPNRAAEEFGYLKVSGASKVCKVGKFIEKPNLKKAKKYLKDKNYLWNAGIFVWKADTILGEIKKHLPKLYSGLQRIDASKDKRRLISEYKKFKNISVDYGVMERARNIYAVRGSFSWQDLGSWDSLAHDLTDDENVIYGLHKGIDTSGSIIITEGKHLLATLGLKDLIVVHTKDATLVCHKNQAQKVKKLTEILERNKHLRQYL